MKCPLHEQPDKDCLICFSGAPDLRGTLAEEKAACLIPCSRHRGSFNQACGPCLASFERAMRARRKRLGGPPIDLDQLFEAEN